MSKQPTKEQIKECLKEAGASGFSFDEESEFEFQLSTRDHGDVGEETPGEEDLAAGRRAIMKLKERFPHIKCELEDIDEWVHLTITFPKPPEPELDGNALTPLANAIVGVFAARGIPATIGPVRKSHNDVSCRITLENSIVVQTEPYPEGFHASFELDRWQNNSPKLTIQGETVDLENPEGCEAAIESLETSLKERGFEIKPRPWEVQEFQEGGVPEDAIVIGHFGYEGPWDDSPCYRLANGDALVKDGGNSFQCLVPKDKVEEALPLLGEFYPQMPEGYLSLDQIIKDITGELRRKIQAEALEGKTTTITAFGKIGTLIKSADGSFYVEDTPEKS